MKCKPGIKHHSFFLSSLAISRTGHLGRVGREIVCLSPPLTVVCSARQGATSIPCHAYRRPSRSNFPPRKAQYPHLTGGPEPAYSEPPHVPHRISHCFRGRSRLVDRGGVTFTINIWDKEFHQTPSFQISFILQYLLRNTASIPLRRSTMDASYFS